MTQNERESTLDEVVRFYTTPVSRNFLRQMVWFESWGLAYGAPLYALRDAVAKEFCIRSRGA